MFKLDVEARLSAWALLRKKAETSKTPLEDIMEFWSNAPFIPHNHLIDPCYAGSWPTPWEIIVENKYDDFTKAVMIGYTLLLTDKFKDSKIEVHTLVDNEQNRLYNIVYVDNTWALNYQDNQAVTVDTVPTSYMLENLVELIRPR